MIDEAKEARVFVRSGSPWIDLVCPNCGKAANTSHNFCPYCSQRLSFKLFYKILDTGGRNIPTDDCWREITESELESERLKHSAENFARRLKLLEEEFGIKEFDTKDHPLLRIMRKEYIKTCFEEKSK